MTEQDRRRGGLAARLLDDLAHLRNVYGLTPDLVVASGDLAEQARPAEYEQVESFLADLADGLDLGRTPPPRPRPANSPANTR